MNGVDVAGYRDGFRRSAMSSATATRVRPGRHPEWFHGRKAAKDLLRLADLTSEDLWRLRRLTFEFQSDPRHHRGAMKDGVLLCWFSPPATWIAESVSIAGKRLGGTSLVVDPLELRARRVGSVENAARVLSSLGQLIVVGGLLDAELSRFAGAASVPVVNGFSHGNNPCEALAELVTLEAARDSLNGFRLAYLGQACDVTHDLMAAAGLSGIKLTVAAPDGSQPDPVVTAQARNVAERNGGSVRVTREPGQAVRGADGIVLGPLPPAWRHLTRDLLADASPEVIVLSCLPSTEADGWPVEAHRLSRAQQEESRPCAYEAVFCALTERLIAGAALADPRG
jgi:ornithine carbamoyltransferase